MEPELLNFINNWTVMRKGRTSKTRRPRKVGADNFKLDIKSQESAAFERKKRRVLHQSTSPPPLTPCINGLSPGSQTSYFLHADSGQQCRSNSLSRTRKTKSKTRLRNTKILKPTNNDLDDFSGIELLAAVACSSIIHVKDVESNCSLVQQNLQDNGKEIEGKKVVLSKELRLHWDLNTVMDEWEKPCDDLLIEPRLSVKSDAAISLVENCNNGSVEETHELIDIKTSDGDSCASKSDVVDLLTHSGKCEDFSNSTTRVLMEQTTIVNVESDRTDNPVVNQQQPVCEEVVQDHVSECCGSNVTQEEQVHMAEGDSKDKLEAGYDSPFEDGELRELIEKTEKETVYESDKIYKDDLGTIENPLSEKVDYGQTTRDHQTSLVVKEGVPHFDESRKDFCERKEGHDDGRKLLHFDKSTSFDVCRNGEYIRRTRSITSEDFSMRIWDLKSHDSNYFRKYNPRGGSYKRTHDRRPSPSERNNGYGSNRGPPPLARSHNRDRYRFQTHDPKQCYLERKPQNFNRHYTRSRSRSRSRSKSRSGSPIAWHFQKRRNLDTRNPDEIETVTKGGHMSPSKCFDDRRFTDGHFRDNRQSSVMRFESRLKSDDYFRFTQRSSQMTSYKYKDIQ